MQLTFDPQDLQDKHRSPEGSDGGSDTIANFSVGICTGNAHTIVQWKYWLDDYTNQDNSGWKFIKKD